MGRNGFKKIMIATDGSDCSMLAAGIGIELARLSSGPVYAMYVIYKLLLLCGCGI
jgi:nucleotide-binding universal stress UspA family protein